MLLVDSHTLARHFVDGDLTKTQFMSLNAALAEMEHFKQCRNFFRKFTGLLKCSGTVVRYSIKWRVKTLWRIIKYSLIACTVFSLFSVYRIGIDNLTDMAHDGVAVKEFFTLLVEGAPEPLPGNIRLAAEYLSDTPQWRRQHVKQFKTMWDGVAENKKPAIRETMWFRTFYVLALIEEAELKKLALSQQDGSMQNVRELRALVNALS